MCAEPELQYRKRQCFILLFTSSSLSSSHHLCLRVLYPSFVPLPLRPLTSTARTWSHTGLKKQTRRKGQLVYKRRHKTRRGQAGVLVLLARPSLSLQGGRCRSKLVLHMQSSEVCHAVTEKKCFPKALPLWKTDSAAAGDKSDH